MMEESEVFKQLVIKAIEADDLVIEFSSQYHPKYIPTSQSPRNDKKAIIRMPSCASRELVVYGDSVEQIGKVLATIHLENALFFFSHEYGHHLTNNLNYDDALARCLALPVKHRSFEDIALVIKEETEAWSFGYTKLEEIGFEIPEKAKKLAHSKIMGYCEGVLMIEPENNSN
jgi:hypothetical protein